MKERVKDIGFENDRILSRRIIFERYMKMFDKIVDRVREHSGYIIDWIKTRAVGERSVQYAYSGNGCSVRSSFRCG
ncbi:MAG: hypothetical protein KKF56_01060 [Nanoarchaeota archaeon]|nr:hypothetical protein [Nanoarchaeota archaeon]